MPAPSSIIEHILNPQFLSDLTTYDVARNI
jgi:hypothetical protein